MKRTKLILAALLLLNACNVAPGKNELPFYSTPDFTPVWLAPGDAGYDTIHTIAPFNFKNQLGQVITNKNTAGKIYVANFFFASCKNICPPMMDNLARVDAAFKSDDRVLILSHTVTPTRDSIPVLFNYAMQRRIDPKKWWLLNGDHDATYKLARKSYFADEEIGFDKSFDEFLHTENLVLVDPKGRIRGVYNSSLTTEVDNLIADIKKLEQQL